MIPLDFTLWFYGFALLDRSREGRFQQCDAAGFERLHQPSLHVPAQVSWAAQPILPTPCLAWLVLF